VTDQNPRVALHLDPDDGRVEQEPLNQREVAPQRQLRRRHGLPRCTDEPFARKVSKQRIPQVGDGHPE